MTADDRDAGPTVGAAEMFLRAQLQIARVHSERNGAAIEAFTAAARSAFETFGDAALATVAEAAPWRAAFDYGIDAAQRSILFWDTLRQRGDNWIAHEKAGKPPLLAFASDIVADGRGFERPVNYSLLRIIPPDGLTVDATRRPFVIIDPRAGHGPGIGGFKQDSQVGVALKAGHPVYFVVFSPEPVPGQTLADVSAAEVAFLRIVRERHPECPKPVIVGNCQGGWASMLVGALDPEAAGPIVVNGAPMSYWAGNDGDNPMRYAGGVLGGKWPALFASDLGAGVFDGAYLVDNFEYLNPANTWFTKYYTLYSRIDTEPPRFLEFERWWGGFFMMNRAEIDWIVDNLFVGNRLAKGRAEWSPGHAFDLRAIRSPIVVFASLGDNITPPQQAINWVADVYPTTEALKANGQVVIGLMHESVGHLGIFVSGQVAKREHTQIVDLVEYIEHLPPGLYAMRIDETPSKDGPRFDVVLTEHRVEDLRRLQRYDRKDEIPFAAVDRTSKALAAAYETFVHPAMAAAVAPGLARIARTLHPQRVQRWAVSGVNPTLAGLKPAADLVRANRAPVSPDNPWRAVESLVAAMVPASLDVYRDLRDAMVEYLFFQTYLPPTFALPPEAEARETPEAPRAAIRAALVRARTGGRVAGLVRIAMLLVRAGAGQRRLSDMKRVRDLVGEDSGLFDLPTDVARGIVRDQTLAVDSDADAALATLGELLPMPADRRLATTLLDRVAGAVDATAGQREMLARIHAVLGTPAVVARRSA